MSISSIEFIVFLIISFFIYYLVPEKLKNIMLLVISCLFYSLYGWKLLTVLLVCACFTWLWGLLLEKHRSRFILAIGVFVFVLIICFYKFMNRSVGIVIPVGLSFYLLQGISYLVDIYRIKEASEHNPILLLLYMCFFPTIVSGPIKRANNFLPQIKAARIFNYERARKGFYLIAFGFIEKVVIADPIGIVVDQAYNDLNGRTGFQIVFATVLYGVQLYCDFAGYSNIAIGASSILGLKIDENFRQPYFAISIKDFWRRWHISLSSWLRDYVYFPLGGSRCSKFRKYFNLMVTFIVSGLWHGTSFNYVFWGALHGIYQIAEDLLGTIHFKTKKIKKRINSSIVRICKSIFVFILVDYAWMFFRAPSFSQGIRMTKAIITDFHPEQLINGTIFMMGMGKPAMTAWFITLLFVLFVDILHEKDVAITSRLIKCNIVVRWTIYLCIVFALFYSYILFIGQDVGGFIYGNF